MVSLVESAVCEFEIMQHVFKYLRSLVERNQSSTHLNLPKPFNWFPCKHPIAAELHKSSVANQ